MSRLAAARDQIVFARNYTLWLLDSTDPVEWFRQPTEGITHIAWQVGHLAMAEYRLALVRIRGQRPEDAELISEDFVKRFGPSPPDPDPARNPSPAEIRAVLDRVHRQALHELQGLSEEELDQPTAKPHPKFTTKLGSLFWCGQHEMLHAGQIGLLRRLLGHAPLW
jgi:hypothetical protein